MDRVQHNGGTFGILAGVALALLFITFASTGATPDILGDPARALPVLREKVMQWKLIGLFGALTVGFGLPFTVGVYLRTRTGAPTRAVTALLLVLVGLVGHALGSLVVGAAFPAIAAVSDQAVAAPAYVAVVASSVVADALGNGFTGAGFLVFGWAIISTGVLSALLGWVFAAAGILGLLGAAVPELQIVFLGNILLTIVSLIWGGVALRRALA